MSVGGGLAAVRATPLVRLGGRRGGGGSGGGGCSGRKRVSLESALICNWDEPCRDRKKHNEYTQKEGNTLTECRKCSLRKEHGLQIFNQTPLMHCLNCPWEAVPLLRAEKESKSNSCISQHFLLGSVAHRPYHQAMAAHFPTRHHREGLWITRGGRTPHGAKTPCEISQTVSLREASVSLFRLLCHKSAWFPRALQEACIFSPELEMCQWCQGEAHKSGSPSAMGQSLGTHGWLAVLGRGHHCCPHQRRSCLQPLGSSPVQLKTQTSTVVYKVE